MTVMYIMRRRIDGITIGDGSAGEAIGVTPELMNLVQSSAHMSAAYGV
jgi:hypothetical protein